MEKKSQYKQGRWTKTQQECFLQGIEEYGKRWVPIQKLVQTRSLTQIRTHAQKHFAVVQKQQKEQLAKQLKRTNLICSVPRKIENDQPKISDDSSNLEDIERKRSQLNGEYKKELYGNKGNLSYKPEDNDNQELKEGKQQESELCHKNLKSHSSNTGNTLYQATMNQRSKRIQKLTECIQICNIQLIQTLNFINNELYRQFYY